MNDAEREKNRTHSIRLVPPDFGYAIYSVIWYDLPWGQHHGIRYFAVRHRPSSFLQSIGTWCELNAMNVWYCLRVNEIYKIIIEYDVFGFRITFSSSSSAVLMVSIAVDWSQWLHTFDRYTAGRLYHDYKQVKYGQNVLLKLTGRSFSSLCSFVRSAGAAAALPLLTILDLSSHTRAHTLTLTRRSTTSSSSSFMPISVRFFSLSSQVASGSNDGQATPSPPPVTTTRPMVLQSS